ncbi:MAG: uroporphyrinogen-III synthase [Terracidiphilus sp.]
MSGQSLVGRRILVTRAAHQAGKLSDGLRALGAEPVEVPVLEIRPPESFAAFDAALRSLGAYDWLILTSTNTVKAFADRAAQLGIALVPPSQTNLGAPGLDFQTWEGHSSRPFVAAVGEATAAAAQKIGLQVALVPESYVAESLVTQLKSAVSGRRVLVARAAIARDVIPEALRQAGAQVDVADAYRNILPEAAPELLRRALSAPIDAVTFTSSSSATHLAEAARRAGIAFPLAGVPAISIGPITSQTLRQLGWEPAAEANPSDIPGLIAAVAQVLQR